MGLNDLYWFLGAYLVIDLFYLVFSVLKRKKLNPDKIPVELRLLMNKYHLDMSKISYRGIMNRIALVSSFDIAFTSTFVFRFIKNRYLALVIGASMLVPLILITFSFIGKYYVKKGCVVNGNK